MFRQLINFLKPNSTTNPTILLNSGDADSVANNRETLPLFNGKPVPTYPSMGVAVPAVPPEKLLESQSDLIRKLQQASSFSHTDFNELIRPAILRYAEFVHLLPASESNHHCGQGGLLRHGLEVAYHAAMECESKIFAFDHWASERIHLVPRWRMAAILGGMIHDMGKPIIDVGAADHSGGITWNPHESSLWAWLQTNSLDHYFIQWRPGARHKRHEAFNAVALYRLIPEKTIAWIAKHGGQEPMDALVMALSGAIDPRNPLASIIKKSDSKSVTKDIQDSRNSLVSGGAGGSRSLAARLIRAMHDLIESGEWRLNEPGHPIWVTDKDVFGIYPNVLKGAVDILRRDDNSIPADNSSILGILEDWGCVEQNIAPSGHTASTWQIMIHTENRGQPVKFETKAIRFARKEVIPASTIPPKPVRVEIFSMDGKMLDSGGIVGSQRIPPILPTSQSPAPTSSESAVESPPSSITSEHLDEPPKLSSEDKFTEMHVNGGDSPLPPLPPTAENTQWVDEAMLFGSGDALNPLLIETDDLRSTPSAVPSGLRDRSSESDLRDDQMREAYAHVNTKWPPDHTADTIAWFEKQGHEGAIVLGILKRMYEGNIDFASHCFDLNEHVHFRYPESFRDLGEDESAIRDMLERKEWTERDVATQNRATVQIQIENRKYQTLRFSAHLSAAIRQLFPNANNNGIKQSPKRILPLGPYLDEDAARSIHDLAIPHKEDAPFIRAGFWKAIHETSKEKDVPLNQWDSEQINEAITLFCKQHKLKRGWCLYHLRCSDNPLLVNLNGSGNRFAFNDQYNSDTDNGYVFERRQ